MLELILHNKSTMNAEQQKMDAISNNIANIETTGYKKENVDFDDLVYDTLIRKGYPTVTVAAGETGQQSGTGIRANGYIRDNTQGSLLKTGMSTDLALDGSGYFKVTKSDGTAAYERSGNFNIDSAGKLVDKNGNRLEVNFTNGEVPLSAGNFTVADDGTISVKSGTTETAVGKINVYDVVGQASMVSEGDNLYVPKPGVQMYQTNGTDIKQGYEEKSNVDISKEITDMISTQRAFEFSSKSLSVADEMWQMVNNMRK